MAAAHETGCMPWMGGKRALEQRNAQLSAQVAELEGRVAALNSQLQKQQRTGVAAASTTASGLDPAEGRSRELAEAIAERDAAREAAAASELRAAAAERDLAAERARLADAEKRLADAETRHRAELENIQVRVLAVGIAPCTLATIVCPALCRPPRKPLAPQ